MTIRAYLDNNATTRLAPEALAAMTPYLTELYLNPSSTAGDLLGAARPLRDAKRSLAVLFGAPDLADGFVLTSGASEANSWATHIATMGRVPGHIVSTAIEHPSMLAALEARRSAGWTVDLVRPDAAGRVHPEAIAEALRPDTALVSVMLANNETGVVQPVAEIADLVRENSPAALFHVDATQALGRIPVSLDSNLSAVDLVSLSAHKFHGPKGIGALFLHDYVTVAPLIHGSQEGGRRGGTPDSAAAAGLAEAARLAHLQSARNCEIRGRRDAFEAELLRQVPRARILGLDAERLPNTSCFLLPGLEAETVVETLAQDGVVVASGSACTSGSPKPSHVLLAMGVPYEAAKTAVRISLSRETREQELDLALRAIERLTKLRV